MAWLTVDDLIDHIPLQVFDANGQPIRRAITGFDPETGEVESQVLTPDGKWIEEPEYEIKKRREQYAAPLHWYSITPERADAGKLTYLDLAGK